MHLPGAVVHRAVNAAFFIGTGRRDFHSLAAEHPGFGQGRVEMNFTLIEVEEFELGFGGGGFFFRNASSSFFSS